MKGELIRFVSGNLPLLIVFGLLMILIGIFVGYYVGNISLRRSVTAKLTALECEGFIQKSIINNVGLGVIAYDKKGVLYANSTLDTLQGFISEGKFPKTLEVFLNTYDKNNQLKSNYLLGLENGINTTRANYIVDKKIYEIKIIRKTFDTGAETPFKGETVEIVIIDDITQIKDDERRQKDLAANVSHELKTPLTVIKATDFLIEHIKPEDPPSYEEIRKWGKRIKINVERMEDIVKDFLVLSQTSQVNRMGIFDVTECINKAINSVSEYTGRDKVNIIFEKSDEYPLAYGNDSLTMRVVINLLTNAIKYINYDGKTEPNEIRVRVDYVEDRINISVGDNGMGIPEKDLSHLFERFYRVDNSGSRDVGGSGIGLAIAKEIADMHDGSIAVASKVRSGSTFTFMLPSASAALQSAYDDAKAGVISDNKFYRAVSGFLALQVCEATRSIGYDDLMELVNEYESIPETQINERDKKLTELLKAFGDERYADLVEELLYVDPDMMDDEGFEENIDAMAEMPEESGEATVEAEAAAEPEAVAEEAPVLTSSGLDKEEAKKMLTREILPRSTQYKAGKAQDVVPTVNSQEQIPLIHPTSERKMYNSSAKKQGKKRESLFEHLKAPAGKSENGGKDQGQVRSQVRQMLDDNDNLNGNK